MQQGYYCDIVFHEFCTPSKTYIFFPAHLEIVWPFWFKIIKNLLSHLLDKNIFDDISYISPCKEKSSQYLFFPTIFPLFKVILIVRSSAASPALNHGLLFSTQKCSWGFCLHWELLEKFTSHSRLLIIHLNSHNYQALKKGGLFD